MSHNNPRKYEIRSTGCLTLFAATKKDALRLGYRLARSAFFGGTTTVALSDPADCYPIAKWVRQPGRRPVRIHL